MANLLAWLTIFVNVIGLAVTLGLGLYLVTHNVRSRLAWLAALTLWLITGFYLHNTLLIYLPGSFVLPWLRISPLLALALGFHLLLLLPPHNELHGRDFFMPPVMLPGRGKRSARRHQLWVPLIYGLTLLLLAVGVFPMKLPEAVVNEPVVLLSERTVAPLYVLIPVYLLLLLILSFLHLWQLRMQEPQLSRRQAFKPLFAAVLLTCFSGLYLLLGVQLHLPITTLPADIGLGAAAVILGYVVTRHYAELAGVNLQRDLLYMGLVISSITIVCVVVAYILHLGGHQFSTLTLVMIVIAAVSSLMLYDALRSSLDRLFYSQHFRQLRANLRALSRDTGIGQSLPERLQLVLKNLCATLHIRRGLIALRDGDTFVCRASEHAAEYGAVFSFETLAADEITSLPLPDTTGPQGLLLLVPIHIAGDQVAALALGETVSEAPLEEEHLVLLEDLADQIGAMIHATRLQEENVNRLEQMVSDFRQQEQALHRQVHSLVAVSLESGQSLAPGEQDDKAFVSSVEDALRRLYDYPYLGEHALARLEVVQQRLDCLGPGLMTHLDRGKALSQVLVQAMNKLRPEGPEPRSLVVPPREWHAYLILHSAYVTGEPNRDIMSRLYIGEGTFNRTRRRALQGLAKAVQEMDQAVQV